MAMAAPRLAWLIVGLLWIDFLVNYVDQVVFSIFPVLKLKLGFSDAQLGLIGTVFIWVYSLCMPFMAGLRTCSGAIAWCWRAWRCGVWRPVAQG